MVRHLELQNDAVHQYMKGLSGFKSVQDQTRSGAVTASLTTFLQRGLDQLQIRTTVLINMYESRRSATSSSSPTFPTVVGLH